MRMREQSGRTGNRPEQKQSPPKQTRKRKPKQQTTQKTRQKRKPRKGNKSERTRTNGPLANADGRRPGGDNAATARKLANQLNYAGNADRQTTGKHGAHANVRAAKFIDRTSPSSKRRSAWDDEDRQGTKSRSQERKQKSTSSEEAGKGKRSNTATSGMKTLAKNKRK